MLLVSLQALASTVQEATPFASRNDRLIRYILTAVVSTVIVFVPIIATTNNGNIIEVSYYYPWTIYQILQPAPIYNTFQLKMEPWWIVMILNIPSYYALYYTVQILNEKHNKIKSAASVSVAVFLQILLVMMIMQSGGYRETKSLSALPQFLIILVLLGVSLYWWYIRFASENKVVQKN